MSNKQPEALRLAECLNDHEYCTFVQMDDAASELRRLHWECLGVREHRDEMCKEVCHLHEVNQKLLDALKAAVGLSTTLAKAKGEQL